MSNDNDRLLQQQATRLLRQSGFTWAGREQKRVIPSQHAFERRMVTVCTRGQSRRRT